MTKALTIEQYRAWVNEYLNAVENYAEETGEEQVVAVGELEGSASVYGPSDEYDSKRIQGQIGWHSDLWEYPESIDPIDSVVSGHVDRKRLLGSVVVPRDSLSSESEDRISEQQEQYEEHYGDEDQ